MTTVSLFRPPSAITFICSSSLSSSSTSLPPRLFFHGSKNGAPIDCRIIGRGNLKPSYGTKGVLRLLPFSSLALDSSVSTDPSFLSSSVGSPPQSVSFSQWNLGSRHILLLNITACMVAISASWLFFSAIPTLLAFKRAAESLEKLLDVTAEELPDTMATMRLCGMEISDLTMELSDLGQGIKQSVRSSTQAVRVAEERLRRLTTMDPIGAQQNKTDGETALR
ncbi:uncharacterized protein LOC110022494 isoform X2 [Phalaenopsis equestris]|uniref:uncharacterized protein LOC110022494 isoform X2 n=1 Tax=Phalaenopsis equestris TaxID=78828 RepID=UPI0009E2F10E|nr:uncharacterized protein LOC110022494 isoform X2 [Phalaenopsis equestris]